MKQVKRCPRFTTIRMASDGDNEAIEKILEHYITHTYQRLAYVRSTMNMVACRLSLTGN